MSSRKRGQAGRERQQGRELKMGIIHVTIQIVPTDMICRVENVDKRDARDHRGEGDTKDKKIVHLFRRPYKSYLLK